MNATVDIGYNSKSMAYNFHRVNVTFNLYDNKHTVKYNIDSGASITSIFYPEYWNYKLKEFKTENTTNDSLFVQLNDAISFRQKISLVIGDNSEIKSFAVGFKPNIQLSVGELPPITNQTYVVPYKKIDYRPQADDDLPNLLGIDIISKFTLIFAQFGGVNKAVILPLLNFDSIDDLKYKLSELGTPVLDLENKEYVSTPEKERFVPWRNDKKAKELEKRNKKPKKVEEEDEENKNLASLFLHNNTLDEIIDEKNITNEESKLIYESDSDSD